jgi:hypothetical protein
MSWWMYSGWNLTDEGPGDAARLMIKGKCEGTSLGMGIFSLLLLFQVVFETLRGNVMSSLFEDFGDQEK